MTDPSRLSELLERAVPAPPPLAGLAARAETDARRARTRRRGAVGAAAVVVIVVATSLVVRSSTPSPVADEPTSSTREVEAPCLRSAPERDPGQDADASSVRFCPPGRRLHTSGRQAALVPQLNLVTDVEATVARLDAAVERGSRSFCIRERNPFLIQITSTSGTVRHLSSDDCGEGFPILLEAIGRQASAGTTPALTPLSCQLQGPPDRAGDAAFPPYAPLLTLPAVQAVRCTTYAADMRARSEVEDPEELRAALLSDVVTSRLDCTSSGPPVTWVIRLADGSIHTAGLDHAGRCGAVDLDKKGLGLAGPTLSALAGG